MEESLALVAKQGYQRLLLDGKILQLEDIPSRITHHASRVTSLTVIQDRLRLADTSRPRFVEACEQAYHFGKGKLAIHELPSTQHATRNTHRFSNRLHCASCDIEYREPSPALFSFNHPVGACPTCRGFGRVINIDYDLALPDRSRTLAQGVVKPWQTGLGAECQDDLLRTCRKFRVPTDVPFDQLPGKWQDLVIEGEPDYGKDTGARMAARLVWRQRLLSLARIEGLQDARARPAFPLPGLHPLPGLPRQTFPARSSAVSVRRGKPESRSPKTERRPKGEIRSPN